ncbi:C39 family peptidase [Pseudoduganella sp. GCM10020061]|uniref:C39 family peptidase n=1 Tax=Pseudoduganella sp. GCM10020061 TaxID=3317345 RepID=UPI00362CA0BF
MKAAVLPILAAALIAAPAAAIDFNPAGVRFQAKVASIKELRFRGTLRQQYDFSCGSAALATLLTHHYGKPVSERFVFERMFLAGDQQKIRREGFSLLDMKKFLKSMGYQADGFEQPLHKLAQAGVPAIVLITTNGYQHFVVIKGLADGRVLIGDPAMGTLAVPLHRFEQMWTSRLLFVIHGAKVKPAFNTPSDWRAAPRVPLGEGLDRRGLDLITIPKLGPGDF